MPEMKRLVYLSTHRGTKENDILLGRFVQRHLAHLSEAELALYRAFLEESDPEIYAWVMGDLSVPERYRALIEQIRQA